MFAYLVEGMFKSSLSLFPQKRIFGDTFEHSGTLI